MAKIRSYTATLQHLAAYNTGGTPDLIGALSSIGEIAPGSDELDVTTLDSTGGYKEFLQGFKDSGELVIEGFHDKANAGQAAMRTLYGTGANGYWWVTFPDATAVIFTAYVKAYKAGAAAVDGAVGFGATLRIVSLVQIISTKLAVAQTVTAGAIEETMDGTATVLTGSPTYQWYECDDLLYTNPAAISGKTSATCEIPTDKTAGTYYFYVAVTVSGYRAVPGDIHVITVEAA